MKKLYTFVILALISIIAYTQTSDLTNTISKNKSGILITHEQNSINIIGAKIDFLNFQITKNVTFKVLNSDGLKKFSKFILPETFDPTYILHYPENRNYAQLYSKLKCNYFKGSIKSKNGKTKEAIVKQSIEPVRMVMAENNWYGNFEKYIYEIENIEVGDEVNIEYNYEMPYIENALALLSFRIFFNSDVFKENYQLAISYNDDLKIDIYPKNGAMPDSTVINEKRKTFYWSKNNLAGSIAEEGSIPYLSLPHLAFTLNPNTYVVPKSLEVKHVPMYVYYANNREKSHLEVARAIMLEVKTKSLLLFRDFIVSETKDITNDSLGYQALMKVQNTIADEFSFSNDTNYFKRMDIRDPKFGEDVSAKRLRDINKYDLYAAILLKLGMGYFTTYVCDKRTGEMNDEFYAPMYNGDILFTALLRNNSAQYIYPKSAQFGYYLNELPFYFENSKARLIQLDDYTSYKIPINETLRQIRLPNSTVNDNIRRSNILTNLNLDSLSVSFDARISLSGQYSTLTRGLYMYNYQDKSINNLYHKKVWELNSGVSLLSSKVKVSNKEFPFSTSVNVQYKANNLLSKEGDTISIDLKNWFYHVIYNNIDTTNRQLDFYPDFLGKDTYTYFLQFNKNVKLISAFPDVEIKNDFGELIANVKQEGSNTIKITSFFSIISSKVTADKIKAVKAIYDKIEELNKSCIKIIAE
jgi:hypothetical protein